MREKELIIDKYLLKDKKIYQLKVNGGITVQMEYSNNNKYFNECLLNIIKEKIKK